MSEIMMHTDVERILVSAEEIDRITTKIAAKIDEDYKKKTTSLLGAIAFLCVCSLIWQQTDK